jgi:hypothetical protein
LKAESDSEERTPSSRGPAGGVKSAEPTPEPVARSGRLRRHFEGWQAGAVAVWIAVVAAALAVPRPATEQELPEPIPDRRALSWTAEAERELAAEAKKSALPFEVRAVGELFRRYGAAVAEGRADAAGRILSDLRDATRTAGERHGVRALQRLRAVQGELFERAVEEFERTGERTRELDELGGNLVDKAEESGWLVAGRLLLGPEERAIFFRIRWAELTGVRSAAPFAPTLDEWRVYYGFLLAHPEGPPGPARLRSQFAYVTALSKRDSTYPLWLARGVLQFRQGAMAEAAEAFRNYLAEHPDGPYTLRAKNYLLATLAKAQSAE